MSTEASEKTETTQISNKELADLLSVGVETEVIDTNPFRRSENKVETALATESVKKVESEPKPTEDSNKSVTTSEDINKLLSVVEENSETLTQESNVKQPEKIVVLDALKDLIKENKILLFEEPEGKERSIEEYSKKEITELLQANMERIQQEAESKAPAEFFDSLSPELQYLAKYEADGGKDTPKVLKYLADFKEIQEIDITTEEGQEQVIRAHYASTNFGTPEEIEEELNAIKDRNELEKKATQFKPKVEAKKQQKIEQELKIQENIRLQKEAADTKYREAVHATLAIGDLEGLKLTPTQQGMIYNGLVQGVDGIRELLKSMPDIKPTLPQLAKVYWMLKDPKGFESAFGSLEKKESNKEIFKQLKTANAEKTTATLEDNIHKQEVKRTVPKKQANIFART